MSELKIKLPNKQQITDFRAALLKATGLLSGEKALATAENLAAVKQVVDTLAAADNLAAVKQVVDALATAANLQVVDDNVDAVKGAVDARGTAAGAIATKGNVDDAKTALLNALPTGFATATDLAAAKAVIDTLATATNLAAVKQVVDALATAANLQVVDDNVDAVKGAVDARGTAAGAIATKGNVDDAKVALQGSDPSATLTAVAAAVAGIASSGVATVGKQDTAQASLNRIELMLNGQMTGQAGIVHEAIRKDSTNTVSLSWKDPKALIVVTEGGVTYSRPWHDTIVVKKLNGTPANPTDGTVVVTETVRNKYATQTSAYVDTQSSPGDYVYRAFARDLDGNYAAIDASAGVFKSYVKYAFVIDETNSVENPALGTSCVAYAEDNKNFDPLYVDFAVTATDGDDPDAPAPTGSCHWGDWEDAFFMPKPCMLKNDGTVDYYLNPDDLSLKADGVTASDISNTSYAGNAMMEWPQVFVKIERITATNQLVVYVSNEKLDEDYECNSAKYEHDGVVGYADHFYTAIFEGTLVSNKLRSLKLAQKPSRNTTAAQELAYARANDSVATNKYWAPRVWADEDLLRLLTILVTKRLNTQAAISNNPASGSSEANYNNVGTGYKKGMFYGHAGTSAVNSKCFGMENCWGHRWDRLQGINMVNGKFLVNLYLRRNAEGIVQNDFQITDDAASYVAYEDTGITFTTNWSESYIKKVTGQRGCMFAPYVCTGAGDTTYFCDACWSNVSGVRGFTSGGNLYRGSPFGLFASTLIDAPSYTLWAYGASLSCKPF